MFSLFFSITCCLALVINEANSGSPLRQSPTSNVFLPWAPLLKKKNHATKLDAI